MKKIKLLMPILSASILAPTIMTIASCGNDQKTKTTITLDKTELSMKMDDEAVTLKATVSDSTATVSWESSNANVAKVSNGVVTPTGAGEATIKATANNVSATCKVTVTAAEISIDSSTAKEQTTNTNKTITQYAFNVNASRIANEDDEIEVEAEDVETTDDVTIQISAIQYEPSTGKCYVNITISKEDGTLNDEETVTFSLNFHCHAKGSKTDRWTHKIRKFVITHSVDQIWSGHFDDTDLTKKIKVDKENATIGTEQTETIMLPINSNETWKEEGATKDEYDLSKLNIYLLQDIDRHHFIDTIKLPEYSKSLTKELKTNLDGSQYLLVNIPFTITQLARYGTEARFSLLFTYPDKTVFQSIGGLSIKYVESLEEEHIELISSREQHYYNALSNDDETGNNVISFILDDSAEYKEDDFTITSSNERIQIGNKYIFKYETEYLGNINVLTVGYSIKDSNPQPKPEHDNLYNVSLTVESKNSTEGASWEKTFKGFSFYKGTTRFEEGTLVSADKTKLPTEYKAGTEIEFVDVLKTCKPFNLAAFTYVYSYATVDNNEVAFDIENLGYDITKPNYSKATLYANSVTAGSHDVKIYVYVISAQAAFSYSLNLGSIEFKA